MKPFAPRSRSSSGFTLVEILVSLAVLGLMMVGVAQILNGTLSTSLGAYKHMDADTQARVVLDRMAYDIAHIVKRPDVDYYFQKNPSSGSAPYGNDQMAFYSESSGYYPGTVNGSAGGGGGDVSLVGYMIAPMQNGVYNSGTGTLQLCRLSKGLAWNGFNSTLAMIFNPLANAPASGTTSITSNTITANWPGIVSGTDTNYQVIGDQIFRLEYTFLVQSSPSGLTNVGTGTATPYTSGGFYDKPWSATTITNTPNAMKDVTAIVVSIAVLDNKTRAMLGSNVASSLATAASNLSKDGCSSTVTNFSNGSASGYLPLTLWKTNLLAAAHLGFTQKEVWQQVRFYQRFCYLNHLQ
jgi:prepilin-type N-terminal cleavage/methylation domain-containing protein